MLNSVVIEIKDEYIDNDLLYLSDKGLFGLTQLGGYYGLALLIAMKKMDEGYTPLGPVIYHNYPEDALIPAANGGMTLTRSGIDWTVQYMADHKFNQFVYEAARKIYEKNIKENI
jgi:hypothetical protein